MSFKVFLVEDEIVVREGIRNKILKNDFGFILCGEARDGEMALSMLNEASPDIIITDIKMPFMNGLEFAKIVRSTMPRIKIIILSGYDEFEYAKEAISIGVTEYLLKPIDSNELFETLNKVSVLIKIDQEKENNLNALKEEANLAKNIKHEKLINDFILGIIPTSQLIDYANKSNLNLISKYYQILIVSTEISNNDFNKYLKIKMLIENLKEDLLDYIITSYNLKKFIIIVKGSSIDEMDFKVDYVSKIIKEKLFDTTDNKIKFALGTLVSRLIEISESYNYANSLIEYMDMANIYDYLDRNVLDSNSIFELVKTNNVSINDKLKHASKQDLPSIVKEYLENITDEIFKNLLIVQYLYTEILLISSRFVSSFGGDPQIVFKDSDDYFSIISEIKSKEKFYNIIISVLEKTIEFRDTCEYIKYGDLIKKAKHFIEINLSEPDFSLKDVAKYISLSPNHFSAVFSQETGETFIEYLTRMRIKKAKKLLTTTNMRSSDITFNVGYREAHYFSYIFKKNTGLTPREYRNNFMKDN